MLQKHDDLSSAPEQPCKKQDTVVHTCDTSARAGDTVKTTGSLGLTDSHLTVAGEEGLQVRSEPDLKVKKAENNRGHLITSSDLHTHNRRHTGTHTCIYHILKMNR